MRHLPVRYHFILHIDGRPRQLHTFDMAYSDKGWYRAMVSMGAFRHREMKRLVEALPKSAFGSLLHKRVRVDYDYEDTRKMSSIGELQHMKLEHHHHSDLWSLYQAIGYDYKKQRYIA